MGGHIAIHMLSILHAAGIPCKGICITGTPPLKKVNGMPEGFPSAKALVDARARGEDVDDSSILMAKKVLNAEEIGMIVGALTQGRQEWNRPWLADDIWRAEGLQRPSMWGAGTDGYPGFTFDVIDEKSAVEEPGSGQNVPVAVINGKEDPFIFTDYIRKLKYRNLWRGKCVEIEGAFHSPHWEVPQDYLGIWEEFVKDVS